MGFKVCIFLLLGCLLLASKTTMARDMKRASIVIQGASRIAETDENFVCATLDWWPHDKCNYDNCPWGYSSVINMDLSRPILSKAIQAFRPLRIRIGGSLQDQVIYDVGNLQTPCHPFRKMNSGLFGFSKGCLHMKRWDELHSFLTKSGAVVTFGLNALHGRHKLRGNAWGGAWNHVNTQDFINYTVSKGYVIDSWEFGNELSGSGVGASVSAELYGKDLIVLRDIIDKMYKDSRLVKPSLVAPGGFYEQQWYTKLLEISGPGVVDVVTHHIYNLGSGNDPQLVKKILDPSYLSKGAETFKNVNKTIQEHGPWASPWVGESGGAYNSGGQHVSDTFIDSFWYLDQLGMSSKHNTKVYCRQTLVGGFYGLLEKGTFVPNPDYYSALLWHRLMGKGVLAVQTDGPPQLRVYAHCSKGREGVTLLLINLSNQSDFTVSVSNGVNVALNVESKPKKKSLLDTLKKPFAWIGNKASDGYLNREEYHLTPEKGELRSKTMVLNGKPLKPTETGDIPNLEPVIRGVNSPVSVSSLSMSFVVLPSFDASACS
ncbi:Heparanase-like protein 1 [Raphanus sativus]|uniref:Heparanase-like protein 1 n=1 Tax=Raphanus sativus TaxID=3726 RepID=A0A6J0KGQ6_RAPSA|nr:heparanase-like protein 1 [Raphanus sativus]KAJ4883243.1 Heparanase-like protein 1 [Raphanus sativus]